MTLAKGWQLRLVLLGWLFLAIATRLGPELVPLPDISGGGSASTPLASLAAAACAILAVFAAAEPCADVFLTAPSRARWSNTLRVAAVALIGALFMSLIGAGSWLATLNTTSALAAEGIVAAATIGVQLSWVPPMLHFLVAGTFGAATMGVLHPWAWILDPQPSIAVVLASLALLAICLSIWRLSIGHMNPRSLTL